MAYPRVLGWLLYMVFRLVPQPRCIVLVSSCRKCFRMLYRAKIHLKYTKSIIYVLYERPQAVQCLHVHGIDINVEHLPTRCIRRYLYHRSIKRDSRHNVWELHHEALISYLDDRRTCHLSNILFTRKNIPRYVHLPNRQLRMYKTPIFIEYQSQNATFKTSVLFKGAKVWNQLTVEPEIYKVMTLLKEIENR